MHTEQPEIGKENSTEALSALIDSYLYADTDQERDIFFVDLLNASKEPSAEIFSVIQSKKEELSANKDVMTSDTTILKHMPDEDYLSANTEIDKKLKQVEDLEAKLGAGE